MVKRTENCAARGKSTPATYTPFAFASWAFLNEEAEQRLFTGQRRLGPGDWKAGDRLWLVDLVAPFGGAEEILNDLKNKAFPDRELNNYRLMPVGSCSLR